MPATAPRTPAMASIRIPYLVTKSGKHGPRHYWQPKADLVRAGWKTVRLSDDLLTACRQAEEWNQQLRNWRSTQRIDTSAQSADSICNLVRQYQESAPYKSLKPNTRKTYDQCFKLLTDWCGDLPAPALNQPVLEEYHHAMFRERPASADKMITHFRIVWNWANARGLINLPDPSRGIRKRHRSAKGRPWTPDELAHICDAAHKLGLPSIALAIRCQVWHAQRQGDILNLTRASVKNGWLKQSKRGSEVSLEWDPALRADIQAAIQKHPNHTHVIISERTGRPWGAVAFSKNFAAIRHAATVGDTAHDIDAMPSCEHLVCRDLRHTGILELAMSGATTPQIATITGHSIKTCEDIIDRYLVRTRAMTKMTQQRRLIHRNK